MPSASVTDFVLLNTAFTGVHVTGYIVKESGPPPDTEVPADHPAVMVTLPKCFPQIASMRVEAQRSPSSLLCQRAQTIQTFS